jgi:C4-dicarboxylate transporter DctM subunit
LTAALAALLAVAGAPLFIVIALLALLNFHFGGIDLTVIFIEMYRIVETPTLSAIPLFAFSGFLLAESQAPHRLVRFSRALLGWLPGGLAIMTVGLCALFTAFTGASGMTIVALGGLLYPALLKNRYPERFSLGLVTTSGSLGLLFPPSLPLIVYGIVSETAVDKLFIAGITPGLLLVALLSLYSLFCGLKVPSSTVDAPPVGAAAALREGVWELLLPVVVLSGIYSGLVAVSEAAALCAVYVLIIEVFVHREISFADLPRIARETMIMTGSILIILASSMAYTNYLIDAEIPNKLLQFVTLHIESKIAFLLLLNLFLLAVGCMVDMFSALIVVVPLILPIAASFDVHPVHLAMIFLTNLEIGYSTPPVGLNLFIASLRFEKPILSLYWASLPFLGILLLALLIITYVPALSLFLID